MSSIALYTTRLAFVVFLWILIFVGGSDGKVSACDEGDLGFIPESRRSPGEGNGNPLQYSCLENSVDGGVLWATVHGGSKESDTTEQLTLRFAFAFEVNSCTFAQ